VVVLTDAGGVIGEPPDDTSYHRYISFVTEPLALQVTVPAPQRVEGLTLPVGVPGIAFTLTMLVAKAVLQHPGAVVDCARR